MRTIALCEAKCKRCASVFAHPSLGDFAYGEAVFSTTDGRHYVVASSSAEFAQRVSALIRPEHARSFWSVLAALADPIEGNQFTHAIVCSNCGSMEIAYWAEARSVQRQFWRQPLYKPELSGLARWLNASPKSRSTVRPNPSIEGTSTSGLRPLAAAPHVKR